MHIAGHKLKVYFAAPTITSSERRELFEFIRLLILELGCGLTYDWMRDEQQYSPGELFRKNSDGIREAEVVVAEVTFPSTGVGQQITLAMENQIPVIALHAAWKKGASRFLAGGQGDLLRFFKYEKDKLKSLLKRNLVNFGVSERFVKFNFISTFDLNTQLDEISKAQGISRSELVRMIIRDWVEKKKGSGIYVKPE